MQTHKEYYYSFPSLLHRAGDPMDIMKSWRELPPEVRTTSQIPGSQPDGHGSPRMQLGKPLVQPLQPPTLRASARGSRYSAISAESLVDVARLNALLQSLKDQDMLADACL